MHTYWYIHTFKYVFIIYLYVCLKEINYLNLQSTSARHKVKIYNVHTYLNSHTCIEGVNPFSERHTWRVSNLQM